MTSYCYVYALQARGVPRPPTIAGFHQRPLFTVPHRDLEAVVSQIERDKLRMTEANVLHHEAVVEAVRQMGPAIPVRFGTLMRDPVAVVAALDVNYPALIQDLERLGDKVELGLSVLWHAPAIEDALGEDDASGARTPGTRYLQAKLSQYRRDARFREMAGRRAQELDGALAPHALDRRCAVLPTERLMMRAAYLTRPADVKAFQDIFAELSRRHPDLRFLMTGPWPPYSFVTTRESGGGSERNRLLDGASRELRTAAQG
jgi:hypothetical protein